MKPLPSDQDLVGYAEIAALLGLSYAQTRNRLTKKHGFPKPAVRISQKTIWWSKEDIKRWMFGSVESDLPKTRRRGHIIK